MTRRLFSLALTLTVAALVGATVASAQVSDTDLLQQLRADVQAGRQAIVAANMGLTDAEGQAFWPVYREYRNDMAKVGDRLQKLIQDYAEVYDSATEEQAKAMVDTMLAIHQDELKVRAAHLPKLRAVLSEVKVARLLQIENKVDALVKLDLASGIPLIAAAE